MKREFLSGLISSGYIFPFQDPSASALGFAIYEYVRYCFACRVIVEIKVTRATVHDYDIISLPILMPYLSTEAVYVDISFP